MAGLAPETYRVALRVVDPAGDFQHGAAAVQLTER
jgi:hypothetical protein